MRLMSVAALFGIAIASAPSFGQQTRLIVGTDQGVFANVHAHDYPSLNLSANFLPYGQFTGGVRVAIADVNNDGRSDIITGAGGGAPGGHVKVFSGENNGEIRSFFAYDGFSGGIFVGSGRVDGDGLADIITGAGAGAPGGHVKVFSGANNDLIRSFFAYPGFNGGVRVAAADFNGDGRADLVTAPGSGIASNVKVFDAVTNQEIRSFFAFSPSFTGGLYVAAGDVNGDTVADFVVGSDEGSPGQVNVINGASLAPIHTFTPFGTSFQGGVRVAVADLDGDRRNDIIVGTGNGAAQVSAYRGTDLQLLANFMPFGPSYTGGVFVAAIPEPAIGILAATFTLMLNRRSWRIRCRRRI